MVMISHPASSKHQEKPLEVHLENVAIYAEKHIQGLSLMTVLITPPVLSRLAHTIGLLHDIGKSSSFFQAYIRGGSKSNLTHHSYISALVTYQVLKADAELRQYAHIGFKAVQKHHGNLSSFFNDHLDSNVLIDETLEIGSNMYRQIKSYPPLLLLFQKYEIEVPSFSKDDLSTMADEIEEFYPELEEDDAIELFILQNLLYSVLTDADKHDAAQIGFIDNRAEILSIQYSPNRYLLGLKADDTPINNIRTIFSESVVNHKELKSENRLYSITAPTGSGKTLVCMAFANKLHRECGLFRRVLYCLPYTSIIDQNHSIISDLIFQNIEVREGDRYRYIIKHHHLEDYYQLSSQDPDYRYQDYLNDNLVAESWSSACVASTFVQLFHSLIGNRNSMVRKLHNIINSIIVLDEVQSLPPKYYPLIQRFFSVLANRFDTYILTCTATQPFIYESGSYIELCENKLFDHAVFNRVQLTIHPEPWEIDSFCTECFSVAEESNALIVVNTKKTAMCVYKTISKHYEHTHVVRCLSTWHTPSDRGSIIKSINDDLKSGVPLILISTQLIEAGVDLSFQNVFRDFGPLDSIVQVAGRCNRNGELGELGGNMHLVTLFDDRGAYCQRVYDKYLLTKTKECLEGLNCICSNDFAQLVDIYYRSLNLGAEGREVLKAVQTLNYNQNVRGQIPVSDFKLIDEKYASMSLYILTDTKAESALNQLIQSKIRLSEQVLSPEERSGLQISIARAFQLLSQYQISLHPGECAKYSTDMLYINKLSDNAWFVPSEYVDKIYSAETGFIPDPDDAGSCLAL